MRTCQTKFHLFAITIVLLIFFLSSYRHYSFSSTAHDLGIFDQALYLISTGQKPYVSLISRHILADHMSLILYLVAPFYILFPSVYFLFFLQAASFLASSILILKICVKENVSKPLAFSISLAFLLHPTLVNSALFDFHPETIGIYFAFLMHYSYLTKNRLTYFLSLVLLLACKEVMAIPVVIYSLVSLLKKDRRRDAAVGLIFASFWLVFSSSFLIPYFSEGNLSSGINRYEKFGNSLPEILLSVFVKPQVWLFSLFSVLNFKYTLWIVLPFCGAISFRKYHWIVAALLLAAVNLVVDFRPQKVIDYHYSLPIVFFLALACVDSAKVVRSKEGSRAQLVLLFALAVSLVYHWRGIYRRGYAYPHLWQSFDIDKATLTESLSFIDADSSVLTNAYVAPHLSQRKSIDVFKPENQKTLKNFDFVLVSRQLSDVFCDSECLVANIVALDKLKSCKKVADFQGKEVLYKCERQHLHKHHNLL